MSARHPGGRPLMTYPSGVSTRIPREVNYYCQIPCIIDNETTTLSSTALFLEKGHVMLTQWWRIRIAFAVALVCGTVLVGTRTSAPLAAAGEVVFRTGGDVERPQQWTLDDLA